MFGNFIFSLTKLGQISIKVTDKKYWIRNSHLFSERSSFSQGVIVISFPSSSFFYLLHCISHWFILPNSTSSKTGSADLKRNLSISEGRKAHRPDVLTNRNCNLGEGIFYLLDLRCKSFIPPPVLFRRQRNETGSNYLRGKMKPATHWAYSTSLR